MELRLNFCWGFDPPAVHCQRKEMEQKIKKNQTVLFTWEAEGTSCCPEKKKQAEYLRWNLGRIFIGDYLSPSLLLSPGIHLLITVL
jgi:hypothetical protein